MTDARRLGPLSWHCDRVGRYEHAGWRVLNQEQLRLGYLRLLLGQRGSVSDDRLRRLLERAPVCLLSDRPPGPTPG